MSSEVTDNNSALIALGTQGQTVADPVEDIRGRKVQDKDGTDIGKVTDLMIDTQQRKVRFLKVEHGGFLGLGAKESFIPVDAISAVAADVVTVDQSGEHVAAAPDYDPDLQNERGYYGNLSGYYGYQPYWGMGYTYPGYPYYGADPYRGVGTSQPPD
ncbi:sporulation protein YlmC with PRC-barrel domain [Nakamurella sp. UYEF19]|uniref:PRC-barrel domain-containing protein n=1 Tax=Nakamurella sp. UYEF19 TaxID=1756392 RepID=UPI003394D8BE